MTVPLFVLALAAALAAPAATPAPTAEPVLAHDTFTIESKVLGETRRINVYTPPASHPTGGRGLPVLYMPDGGVEEDFPHVTSDVDAAIRSFEMRPMLVVGIENTERRRDMTPPTQVESDRKIAPHVGGAARFRAFLRDELIPQIEQRYTVSGQRAIVGESLAGLFILDTVLAEPKLFDTAIVLSPSLWWNDQALVKGAAARLRAAPDLEATLLVAPASDDGTEPEVKLLTEALRTAAPKGLTWTVEPQAELKHATIYRGASPRLFRRLFPPIDRSAGL